MTESWNERVARFWREADPDHPERLRTLMRALIAERPASDPEALFESASLHDYLGEESEAIPLYRAALESGLAGTARTEAVIQLASSLRNVGDPSGAIRLLRAVDADDPLIDAAQAFLALALHDDDKATEGLRSALATLAPRLSAYSRSVAQYADELRASDRVRSIAVGALVHNGRLLAEDYPPNGRHSGFLRAPGGGIEFGEPAEVAIRREFSEELDVDLDSVRLLAVTENIFDSHGKRGHEIVHVFEVRSRALEMLPTDHRLAVRDSDTTVGWYPLDLLRRGTPPVYPAGILDLID